MTYKNEEGYLQLLSDILEHGVDIPDRTGVGCRAIFGVDVEYNTFCLSTVRPASLRLAFEEMMFFLRGKTNTKELEAKGVNFWKGNTSREFLDNRGLEYLPEGSLGAAYSTQWRNSGGYFDTNGGVDQLQQLVDILANERYSRRNLVMLWNPSENDYGVLTPCWFGSQWIVLPNKDGDDELHCYLFNRSNDSLFGATFAFQQYRFLQLALCKMFGFKLGKLKACITHAHIYHNQIDYVKETLTRELGQQGTVEITKDIKTLDDLLSLEWEDVKVSGLVVNNKPYVNERPSMAV